jgi:hypothetical protein
MTTRHTRAALGTAALAGLIAAATCALLDARQPAMPREDQLKPKWEVGDSWVVEATTQPVQLRAGGDDKTPAPPAAPVKAQYKFTVAAREKLGAGECFRVEITVHPDPRNQPTTKLWLDAKSLALKQLQTQIPVDGAFATVTESYDSKDGPPAPVTGPLTAVPVDMPVFVGGRAGEQSFSSEAAGGPAGAKRAANDVAFAVDIKQTTTPVTPDAARGLLPEKFSRDLETKPLVKVELKTAERTVTQLWQVGRPWPVYTKSGPTEARLVSFTPAKK